MPSSRRRAAAVVTVDGAGREGDGERWAVGGCADVRARGSAPVCVCARQGGSCVIHELLFSLEEKEDLTHYNEDNPIYI